MRDLIGILAWVGLGGLVLAGISWFNPPPPVRRRDTARRTYEKRQP